MKLGTGAKVGLGLATAWPPVHAVLFVSVIVYQVFHGAFARGAAPRHGPPEWFLLLFIGHFVTVVWMFALLAIYALILFKTDRVAQDKKALWAVVLFLGNMVAMPIFFFLYVWKDPPPSGAGGPGTQPPM